MRFIELADTFNRRIAVNAQSVTQIEQETELSCKVTTIGGQFYVTASLDSLLALLTESPS